MYHMPELKSKLFIFVKDYDIISFMDITLTKHTEEKIKNPNCAFCNAENADSLTIQTCEKNYSTVFLCENCLKEFKEKVAQL